MNIHQAIYRTIAKKKSKPPSTSEAEPTVQLTEIVDKLLAKLQKQGNLQHFSWVVQNDPNLQAELNKITDKGAFVEQLLALAKTQGGYNFAAQDVMTMPGSWSANSVEELISAFYTLAQGSLEHFLTDVKQDPALQQKLSEKLQTTTDKDNLAQVLVKLGKAEGYSFTAEDVEEVAQGI
ncbi:MAG: Nif11 family protein [Moorea sp. SIO3C2]|nr:Nif11 family protein [Moorena sp. SIO3C2]